MPEHIAELRRMQTRLMEKGYKVDDEEFKSVLVMSLPNSWENFTTSYQGTNIKLDKDGNPGITSQELISIILDEYQRRLDAADDGHDQSFYAQPSAGRGKKRKVMVAENAPGLQMSL